MATHIFHLHASMVAHMQDCFSEFHNVTASTCRLLQSLSTVVPRVELRACYHDYSMIEAIGQDRPRFQPQGAWVIIATELLHIEEFEYRGIISQTVWYIFPLLYVPPPPTPLALVQASPPPPTRSAPQLPTILEHWDLVMGFCCQMSQGIPGKFIWYWSYRTHWS